MSEKQLDWMAGLVKAGRMDRREFTGRAAALGVGAAAAATALSAAGVRPSP